MNRSVVLVIEDNPEMARFIRLTLEAEGCKVLTAGDAATARELVRIDAPNLIIQDLMLPDSTGLSLTNDLQASQWGRDVPIIALSGARPRLQDAWSSALGFAAYLEKPVEPSVLVSTVVRVVAAERLQDDRLGENRPCLVVDDNDVQRRLLSLRLEAMHFAVSAAPSASEALVLAAKTRPTLIVSDLLMPAVNGFSFCSLIRADSRLATVPFVLVSVATPTPRDRERASEVGVTALIMGTPDFWGLERAVRNQFTARGEAI